MLAEQPKLQAVDIERLREHLGLNDPLPLAYAKWLSSALRLDFGLSYQYERAPLAVMGDRLGATLQLAALAYVLGLLGIPLGILAALRRGQITDTVIRVLTVVGDAAPRWWVALLSIVVLASLVGWFPNGEGTAAPGDWFSHIIIPALILAVGPLVAFTRYTRSQVLEVVEQDYVRTAHAKGLSEPAVAIRHILRNALLPVITLMGGALPGLISGAPLIEGIFNWPGMGRLYLEAASTRDYPLLLAMITVFTMATMLGTLCADILYGFADPRIRYS